jgi:hypothetical protein
MYTLGRPLSIRLIASSLATVERKKFALDAEAILQFYDERQCVAFVVGLPVKVDGAKGLPQAGFGSSGLDAKGDAGERAFYNVILYPRFATPLWRYKPNMGAPRKRAANRGYDAPAGKDGRHPRTLPAEKLDEVEEAPRLRAGQRGAGRDPEGCRLLINEARREGGDFKAGTVNPQLMSEVQHRAPLIKPAPAPPDTGDVEHAALVAGLDKEVRRLALRETTFAGESEFPVVERCQFEEGAFGGKGARGERDNLAAAAGEKEKLAVVIAEGAEFRLIQLFGVRCRAIRRLGGVAGALGVLERYNARAVVAVIYCHVLPPACLPARQGWARRRREGDSHRAPHRPSLPARKPGGGG